MGKVYRGVIAAYVMSLWFTNLLAQGPDTLWTRMYAHADGGSSGQQASDGGYVIVGTTGYSVMWGAGFPTLMKTDSIGSLLWSKCYERGFGISVRQTSNGGYVIAGIRGDMFDTPFRIYLIKTTPNGDVCWEKSWCSGYYAQGSSVQETLDGGYIVVGSTELFENESLHWDVYLIKTDSAGDSLWAKTYGGAGDDYGKSVQQTSDGGFVIAGTSGSFGSDSADIYLIKTDISGNMVWARTYGRSGADRGKSVQQTADGGYIVAGTTESFGAGGRDIYLLRTDEWGDGVWGRIFGGAGDDIANSIEATHDSGYIVAGRTTSFGAGSADAYLLRTNANGDTLWTRTYGGARWDGAASAQQTFDKGYIIVGGTRSFHPEDSLLVYLVKTAREVGIQEDVCYQGSSFMLQSGPNPSTGETFIRYGLPRSSRVSIVIWNLVGQEIRRFADREQSAGLHTIIWNGRDDSGRKVSSGVYFLRLEAGDYTATRKVCVVR